MHLRTIILIIVSSLITVHLYSQQEELHAISVETLSSSGDELPFWLTRNQSGKYGTPSQTLQLLELQSNKRFNRLFDSDIDLKLGVNFISTYASRFDYHFNELYAAIYFLKLMKLEGGLFREEQYIHGLSSTNMNIDRTLNARPYPKIRLATDGFINPFFWKEWLSFRTEYDEGILDDNRYVINPHLHHKSFYLKFKLKEEMFLTAGFNHFVLWGGFHPTEGELPGLESYWLYVSGKPGDSTFINNDQLNFAGNHFGSYYLQFDLGKPNYDLTFYLSHPFEDKSGMEGDNWRDNLIGVFIDLKRKAFFEKAVYEFMYTIHQSGDIHEFGNMRGIDNYYNHSVYQTSFTYQGYTLCSPLFSPFRYARGKVVNIDNTRIAMHHIGVMGSIGANLSWDARLTYSYNLGTYIDPFDPPRHQFSSLLNLRLLHPKIPVDLSLSVGADFGGLYPNRFGGKFAVSKTF